MKKTDNILWNIIDSLRNDIPSYEFANYMIQLVFLKQICSSDFFPNDKEIDYRLIMSVQQIFAGFDSYFNEDELFKTYNMIEKAYNIQFGSLSLSAKKLGRLFSDQTTYKRIIETLRLFSFPTDKSTMIDLINSILDEASYREGKYGGNNITTRPINDIFSGILNAKSGGRLLIPYCGYSRLALNNDFDEIICLSNDEDAIMISNMIMLLTGKRSFKIGRLDASEMQERSNFDKIAVDGPLTGAIYPKNISSNSNSIRYEIFNITYPWEHLNIGGIAVITSVIAPLNTQTAQYKELRKRLISGDLKAVINLPPLWLKTGVNTNIIVL